MVRMRRGCGAHEHDPRPLSSGARVWTLARTQGRTKEARIPPPESSDHLDPLSLSSFHGGVDDPESARAHSSFRYAKKR